MNSLTLDETLAALVRINSVNPAYQNGPGEGAIAGWIRNWFHTAGIETREQPVFPGRYNLIARLPGRLPGRRLILEAHMDTASVQGMLRPPFEPLIEGGRLHGRGACDTKGGLAAMMHAVREIHRSGHTPPCETWLAAVVDEEFSYRGVVRLCENLQADAALVAEPTSLRAVIASKGVVRWRIELHGRAAHSSKPHLGINAIQHMARLLLEIEGDHARLAHKPHPLLGPATCNVGLIHGGTQVNFVPDHCTIELDRRLLPGESVSNTLDHYQHILDRLARQIDGFNATMESPMLTDEPLETPPDSRVATIARDVLHDLGLDNTLAGVPFGSDASKLSRQGVPSVVFGPGNIDQAHAADEFVELHQVRQAADFYRNFILRFE